MMQSAQGTDQDYEEVFCGFETLEATMPSVYTSSQSSESSETSALCSQHLISDVCERDCGVYWPTDDLKDEHYGLHSPEDPLTYSQRNLPLNFVNSSLALSPISIPPKSPNTSETDLTPLINVSLTSDVTLAEIQEYLNDEKFEPIEEDTATSFFDDFNWLTEYPANISGNLNHNVISDPMASHATSSPAALTTLTSPAPSVTSTAICATPETSITYNDLILNESLSIENCLQTQQPSLNSSDCSALTLDKLLKNVSNSNSLLSPQNSNSGTEDGNNSSYEEYSPCCSVTDDIRKACKRKHNECCVNTSNKKKDQNKKAARRYRDKKKVEEKRLEELEMALIKERKSKKKELRSLLAQRDFLKNLITELFQKKKGSSLSY